MTRGADEIREERRAEELRASHTGHRRCQSVSSEITLSGQDRSDDLPGRVGQAIFAAVVGEGQPGVVEAQQVEDRGVEVVDVDAVDLGAEADGVGRAVDRAALDPRRRPASR